MRLGVKRVEEKIRSSPRQEAHAEDLSAEDMSVVSCLVSCCVAVCCIMLSCCSLLLLWHCGMSLCLVLSAIVSGLCGSLYTGTFFFFSEVFCLSSVVLLDDVLG
jgi:hypothetical protein